MFERRLLVLGIVFLMASGSTFITTAAPSVKITSPAGGSILTSRAVNVTGTASGSDARWLNGSREDFNAGVRESSVVEAGGNLALNTLYDDFNDNSFDANRWTKDEASGFNVNETGGALNFSGTSTTATWWESHSDAYSTNKTDLFFGDVRPMGATAEGYGTGIGLFQDANNNVLLGIYHDPGGPGLNFSFNIRYNGVLDQENLFDAGDGPHRLGVTFYYGKMDFYADSILLYETSVALSDPVGFIEASVCLYGDAAAFEWDNVTSGYVNNGKFTSQVYDTLTDAPILERVDWNASTPDGTAVSVEILTCDTEDMASPYGWQCLTNGQVTDRPEVKRFLQYQLTLTSSDQLSTPVFKDITITYSYQVAKVELSSDNMTTWKLATGTTSWYATLSLSENTVIIWVRVTDAAGDTNVTSVTVEVDTTPPKGSVVINDGEPFTTDQYVTLTLNATDRYDVQSMMISNFPDFEDATWDDYSPVAHWYLSIWDGMKTVYVKYKDTNGWESKVCSDSILLVTMPPTGSILIDDGAEYTRNTTVTVSLNATDPSGLDGMMLSNTPDFLGAQWTGYKESLSWALVPGSENRTVYVKFRDMAGLVSQAYSDSIIEDLISPAVTVFINGGAPYTQSLNVVVELRPVEDNVVTMMQAGEGDGSFPDDQPWVALMMNMTLTLSAGEGTKMVSARLMDAAGNIGESASSTILYDPNSPTTKIDTIPETSPKAKVTVSWSAADATSGVLWYDVQSKAGDGSWIDWLSHVNQTSSVFTGEDLQTYQFRARAEDKAGNLEDFPTTVDNSVTIQLPEPTVIFILPKEGATLSGKATFNGTCQLVTDGRNVTRVEWNVDNTTWQTADGLLIWGFKLDTTKLKDGKHVVQVRTYDGKHYSTEVERQFKVSNAKAKSFLGADGLVEFALAVGVTVGFVARRRGLNR